MLELKYPKVQSLAWSNKLFDLYHTARNTREEEIRFDFSKTISLTPFSIILITATVEECIRNGKKCFYRAPKNRRLREFLRDIGFIEFWNLSEEEFDSKRIQSPNIQLRKLKGLNPLFIDEIIEVFDFHLNLSEGVRGSLKVSLSETMQNVVTHSESDGYYICAWSNKRKKQLQLCISDLGIGILSSLQSSEEYSFLSNHHRAIRLATEEGVTSRPSRNAGLGLNHIKNFISINKGKMCIISGNGKVFWKFDQGKILEQDMKIPFSGTVIKLEINTDREGYYFLATENEFLF